MQNKNLTQLVMDALDDLKGNDILAMDVSHLTDVMDQMVICCGRSNRHVRSLANNVIEEANKQGIKPLSQTGEDSGEWVLVDFGDVVVHVMQPAIREFYDLESLWSEPKQIKEHAD